MRQVTITKCFGRVISVDYQSYKFNVELTEIVEVNSDEELAEKSAELFNKCMRMVEADVVKIFPAE